MKVKCEKCEKKVRAWVNYPHGRKSKCRITIEDHVCKPNKDNKWWLR